MSIGTWSPDTGTVSVNTTLDKSWLDRFIAFSRDEELTQLPSLLTPQAQGDLAAYMLVSHSDWQAAVDGYDTDSLWHLMRFLVMAEMHLPGWQAGADSPVIALNKVLKQHAAPLTREQLQWIRTHSDNRFIPNGAL
ncbi:MAG: hypothetical protein EP312_02380 [Gammaproteobacteria bacterium]|nr:MAG: hypothetical protein EP312_02380 [Gammaproteobacteria bacterium]